MVVGSELRVLSLPRKSAVTVHTLFILDTEIQQPRFEGVTHYSKLFENETNDEMTKSECTDRSRHNTIEQ